MRYIDKDICRDEGNHLVNEYLDSCWNDAEKRYCNVDYDDFRRKYRFRLTDLFLRNQSNLCCYCMRNLEDGERVTFEHIIPQTANETTRDYYRSAPNLSEDDVVLTSVFAHTENASYPPYPHTVAYNNLVASCDGVFPDGTSALCCNNRRGDLTAYPVYYDANVSSKIVYSLDGIAISVDCDPLVSDMIDHTGLNCRILQDIRFVWSQLHEVSEDELTHCLDDVKNREALLLSVMFKSTDRMDYKLNLIVKFTKDNYWIKLMNYKFFWEYYKSK
jgi:hypothetical protein